MRLSGTEVPMVTRKGRHFTGATIPVFRPYDLLAVISAESG